MDVSVFVGVAPMGIVDMDGLVAVVLVGIAFVGLVVLHLFFSPRFVIDP